MSVVDEMRRTYDESEGAMFICVHRNRFPLLLDVVEKTEKWFGDWDGTVDEEHELRCQIADALAALESAQGAERPEPGEGA